MLLLLLLLFKVAREWLLVAMLSECLQQAGRVCVVQPSLGTEPLRKGDASLLQCLLTHGMLTESVQRLL